MSITFDENVVVVRTTTELPYAYIPFTTYVAARAAHPHAKLYVYEGKAPAGFMIVAYPILMEKPKDDEAETEATDGE